MPLDTTYTSNSTSGSNTVQIEYIEYDWGFIYPTFNEKSYEEELSIVLEEAEKFFKKVYPFINMGKSTSDLKSRSSRLIHIIKQIENCGKSNKNKRKLIL